jgi:hypothetical protein
MSPELREAISRAELQLVANSNSWAELQLVQQQQKFRAQALEKEALLKREMRAANLLGDYPGLTNAGARADFEGLCNRAAPGQVIVLPSATPAAPKDFATWLAEGYVLGPSDVRYFAFLLYLRFRRVRCRGFF